MSSRSKWRPFKQLVQQNGRQDYVLPIASIDYTKDTITLAGSTSSPIGQGSRYYIFNAADQLNATNEWYYNAPTNTVSVVAPAGFDGTSTSIGSLSTIFNVYNSSNITIA